VRSTLRLLIILPLLVLSLDATLVYGQDDGQDELSLRLSRDFGYGLAGQMQGTFSFLVSGPESLTRVEFILDDEVIGEDTVAPFRFRFDTGDYSNGSHKLKAIGYTAGAQTLQSETITRQFVPGNSVIWIVFFIVAVVIVARIATILLTRSSKGSRTGSATFGYLGGAVCPSCGHPFGIHWWSLRLGIRRYDRCSNCGKWNLIQRASDEELTKADDFVKDLEATQGADRVSTTPRDDAYQQLLDESRFDDN
jgi:hypothetical protein